MQGHGQQMSASLVTGGDHYAPLLQVIVEGWEFGGWYKEGGCVNPWNEQTDTVTADITLYAKWIAEVKTYTVQFDSAGGTAVESQKVKTGGKAAKPADPKRRNYDFVFWTYQDGEHTPVWDFDTMTVEKDVTLTALWEEKEIPEYEVFFDMSGHGAQVATQSVAYKGLVERPEDP